MNKPRSGRPTLSDRAERFIHEYPKDCNATKAAERAGYSKQSAYSQGCRLLKNAEVNSRITKLLDKRKERSDITADRVLRELAVIAFADIGDVVHVDEDGHVTIKPLDQLEPTQRRAISEITQTSTERFDPQAKQTLEKVRLGVRHHSKVAALRMLMDHLGMDAEKRLKIDTDAADIVRKLIQRLGSRMQPEAFKELLKAMAEDGV